MHSSVIRIFIVMFGSESDLLGNSKSVSSVPYVSMLTPNSYFFLNSLFVILSICLLLAQPIRQKQSIALTSVSLIKAEEDANCQENWIRFS